MSQVSDSFGSTTVAEPTAAKQPKSSLLRTLAHVYFGGKRWFYRLRYPTVSIGEGVLIRGSLQVAGGTRVVIGAGSRLNKRVRICGPGEVTIGRNTLINGPWIGCYRSISIGDDCLISDCYLVDTDYHNLEPHLRHSPPGPKVSAPIVIERNVWIGARATVMKGVRIGADSVVGLGAIIRKAVPARVVVIGDPQQIVKHFNPEDSKRESSG
ncbi:DapH/DapD/GlmU-related protein [Leptolyngbya sp. FACHB-261]|uniref:acyltransferase n=1 Tax=Leptolyngbya sp. FACHB-261 TaxID=2692806 RepID=UPI001689887F|nr:acyltransferase [Leptolyngbya sp. FACHB-261]MBD2105037.1 acyltransferase [Leptolyngbya sp. FACHB-261]